MSSWEGPSEDKGRHGERVYLTIFVSIPIAFSLCHNYLTSRTEQNASQFEVRFVAIHGFDVNAALLAVIWAFNIVIDNKPFFPQQIVKQVPEANDDMAEELKSCKGIAKLHVREFEKRMMSKDAAVAAKTVYIIILCMNYFGRIVLVS